MTWDSFWMRRIDRTMTSNRRLLLTENKSIGKMSKSITLREIWLTSQITVMLSERKLITWLTKCKNLRMRKPKISMKSRDSRNWATTEKEKVRTHNRESEQSTMTWRKRLKEIWTCLRWLNRRSLIWEGLLKDLMWLNLNLPDSRMNSRDYKLRMWVCKDNLIDNLKRKDKYSDKEI